MRAWTHGITREQVLDALVAHRTAERLTRGGYCDGSHGCGVGCTLANFDNDAAAEGDHARYDTLFGIARDVALLEDTLFELLPPAENRLWPERFVRAIAPGADVGDIVTRWIIWLLNDEASPVHSTCGPRRNRSRRSTSAGCAATSRPPTTGGRRASERSPRSTDSTGINVTASLCEKAGWDRWAVAIKTPYHARAPSAERRCLELGRQQTYGVEQGGR